MAALPAFAFRSPLTIFEVAMAETPASHLRTVHQWAESVWALWVSTTDPSPNWSSSTALSPNFWFGKTLPDAQRALLTEDARRSTWWELLRSMQRLMGEAGEPAQRQQGPKKMRTVRPATLAALVLTAIAAVSCTDSATTTSPPVTTGSAVGQPLFGFVHRIEAGTLVFDPAEFLTGPEAVAAARAAGVIGPGEDLPNDFYILNEDSTEQQELVVADGAMFTLIGFDGSGALADRAVSAEGLSELLSGEADSGEFYGFVPGSLPMTLSLGGGAITAGAQLYLP